MAISAIPRTATALLAAALALLLTAGLALAAEQTFTATLSGDNELPPVDTEATGEATIVIDVEALSVCWEMSAANLEEDDAFTVSHIHVGTADVEGGVVVNLDLELSGTEFTSEGCTEDELDAALLQAIVDDPAGYYVNVHSEMHGPGVIRGQLAAVAEAPPPTSPDTATTQPLPPFLGLAGLMLLGAALFLTLRTARARA
jgi:hypothetical protein